MSDGAAADGAADGGGFIEGPWPTFAAWLAFAVVAASTLRNVYRHLQNFSRPDLQPHVLRIILVGPIYAFCAALCMSLASVRFFVRSVRDIWEAVVIYSFLNLVIEYMGGEHLCLHSISQREEGIPHLFPLNYCLPPIPMGSMIRGPKIGALQFVVAKPLVAAISIVVYACGELQNWYYQWTLFIIYNISYSVALYALYLIYWASHDHQTLQSKRPLLKFVSVKIIVFLTFWQALLLPHILSSSIGRWEDFILAMEMVVFSLLMNTAFSWQEFHSGLRDSERSCHVGKAGDLVDFGSAGDQAPCESIGRGQVVQNAKAAFCPRDIMQDATANFSRRYQQHVLIESAQEYELHSIEERKIVDLLSDSLPEDGQAKAAAPKAGGAAGSLRTFRARTYLIGRSLFAGSDASGQDPAPQLPADGQDGSCQDPPSRPSAVGLLGSQPAAVGAALPAQGDGTLGSDVEAAAPPLAATSPMAAAGAAEVGLESAFGATAGFAALQQGAGGSPSGQQAPIFHGAVTASAQESGGSPASERGARSPSAAPAKTPAAATTTEANGQPGATAIAAAASAREEAGAIPDDV